MIQIDKKIIRYIKGYSFSSALFFNIATPVQTPILREEFLLDIAMGKKVLHLGFLDHLPLIDEKIKTDKWLHKNLLEVCEKCVGIDNNKVGVEYLTSKYTIPDIYAIEITKDSLPDSIKSIQFDYVFIPDVLEHIPNPLAFLLAVYNKLAPITKRIIITTPNAFRLSNILNVFKNKEFINSDHKFWFTPYTLAKITTCAGFDIQSLGYLHCTPKSRREIFKNYLLSHYSALQDVLYIEISRNNKQNE